MVNGSRYYRALESVSIASAFSSTFTIYPCQIRVHQRWQSKLQLPTARKKEWRPATADSLPQAVTCQHCDTPTLAGIEPTTFRLLVRRATSSATDSVSSTYNWHIVTVNDISRDCFYHTSSERTNRYPPECLSICLYVHHVVVLKL